MENIITIQDRRYPALAKETIANQLGLLERAAHFSAIGRVLRYVQGQKMRPRAS